jgi:hypothetical protein
MRITLYILAALIVFSGCSTTKRSYSILFENAALHRYDSDLNRSWLISADGSVYYTDDSAAMNVPRQNPAFYSETTFPNQPVHKLSAREMNAIIGTIDSIHFFSLSRYAADSTTEDGTIARMTISNGMRLHTVTLVNTENPVIRSLINSINTHLPDRYDIDPYPLW